MKTKLVPGWMRIGTQVALAVPMVGFFADVFESPYFKQYLADVLIGVINSFGTALIDSVIQSVFYSVA
jgi:hypothetical protein